jgi:hypothetical protein
MERKTQKKILIYRLQCFVCEGFFAIAIDVDFIN